MADSVRGRFVWHELMASEPKAAAAFYQGVVGWKPKPYDKNPSYTMLTFDGRRMGGVMMLPEPGAPSNWLSYIGTPNVDATARQAIELGGKVLKPAADIPDVGRFAMLQDPQGANFIAFTPNSSEAAGNAKPGLGDFSWHELITTDWQAAFNFYQKLFGWEKTDSMEMGPGQVYQMFGWKGLTLGGMFNKPGAMAGPPMWLPYVLVPDAKKVVGTIKKLGGRVINGPMEVPGGDWITQGLDPRGVMFAVHSKKQATAAPAPKRKTTSPKKSAAARKQRPTKKTSRKKSKPARSKSTRGKRASRRRR